MLVRGAICLLGKRKLVACQGRGSWLLVREEGADCLPGKRSSCLFGKKELVACQGRGSWFLVREEKLAAC